MAKLSVIVEGLRILQKYGDDRSTVQAEHDDIYVTLDAENALAAEDLVALEELGWQWDAGIGSWWRYV